MAHEVKRRARHLKRAVDVGPVGADDQAVVAGAERHPRRHGDAEHGRARHGDAAHVKVDPVQAVEIVLDRRPQIRPSCGMVVKGQSVVERALGGLADEARGGQVALAEPQGNNRRVADAGQADLGDAVLAQALEFAAQYAHAVAVPFSAPSTSRSVSSVAPSQGSTSTRQS